MLAKPRPERLALKTLGIRMVITAPEKGARMSNMHWALKSNEGRCIQLHYKPLCGKIHPESSLDYLVIATPFVAVYVYPTRAAGQF